MPLTVCAQEQMPSSFVCTAAGPEDSKHIVAWFLRGLRDSGFINGQNVRIVYRWAEGRFDRLPGLAQELALISVTAMVAGGGTPAPVAAKSVPSSIRSYSQ
jgi:putative ABC transport system substrate-binding protein